MGSVVGCKSHMKEKGTFPDYLTSRLVNVTSGFIQQLWVGFRGFYGGLKLSPMPPDLRETIGSHQKQMSVYLLC